jgi:dihydroflavonol-4-reductase
MRVLVTGGTGFVGSHSVAALMRAGHDVRLLVRRADRIAPALEPLGITAPMDHIVGDVTDPEPVARAVAGCDAVLHAAAVYNLDARASRATTETNLPGTQIVLDAAVAEGCDPIVHVSSTVALTRRGTTVTPDSPLSNLRSPYIASKAASEQYARSLQDWGAPIVIVQPGGVYGPHDPHLSDQMRRLKDVLKGRYPMWPTGGYHVVDVRDVAAVHAAVMVVGQGPRRYIVPGDHTHGRRLFGALRAVTGRRLPFLTVPSVLMLPITWSVSKIQPFVPFHIPADHEGVLINHNVTRCDDSRARSEVGVVPRSLEDSLRDSVRWLHEHGHVSVRQAGLTAGDLTGPSGRSPRDGGR